MSGSASTWTMMWSAPASANAVDEAGRRRDHQVDVERLLRVRADGAHDRRADGDVGHEVAVHDVDVDPVGAGGIDGADLLAERGEVGGENRRGDEGRAGHGVA